MKIEIKYMRSGRFIVGSDGSHKDFGSINKAKKASHKLQMSKDGALGRGSLLTVL